MGEKRQYTDGQKQFLISDKEAAALNLNRPAYLPPITPVDDKAKIRANYRNNAGELVDTILDAENVRKRANLGENVVADKDSIEQARSEAVVRERIHMADQEDFTTLVNAALPGAQFLQDMATGENAANQGRQDLSINMAANVVGNIAEFAIGGKMVGMAAKGLLGATRAGKLGVTLGLSKDSAKLAKVGRVAAEEVLMDSHFYVQNNLDTGGEMEAEEWGRQIGTGLIFASPFVLGAAARGVGQATRKAMQGSELLQTLKTGLTTTAVLSAPGTIGAAKAARAAAATGLVSKLFRRSKKGLTATDEAAAAARQIDSDLLHTKRMTPEKLDNMAPGKRREWIERFSSIADEPVEFMEAIKWGTINKNTTAMRNGVENVRREMLQMNKKLQGKGVTDIKISQKNRDMILADVNGLMPQMADVGMTDVKNSLKRGILDGGGDAATTHKALFEARVNARFRRGITGGADIVDDQLRAILEDPKRWGARQAKKNAKYNAALDDFVQTWDDLGETHIPKGLEDIDVNDAIGLGKSQGSIQRIRDNLDIMDEAGFISQEQRVAIETKLLAADDAIKRGTESYGDVIKINRARKATEGRLKKARDISQDVPGSPESFAAAKAGAVMESAQDMAVMVSKGLDALLSTKPMVYGARGVGALHGMSVQDKYLVFDEIQRELSNLVGNPSYLTENLGRELDRGAAYDPQGADMAAQKAMNSMFYLQSQLPPQDMTMYGRGVPQPLSAVEEYLEKWTAAYDPVSVGYATLEGTVTPQMVDSLRITSPHMYSQMQVEFANMLMQAPADKANPKVVTAMSIFMGGMDQLYTGDFIATLQSSYAQTATQDELINGGPQQGQTGQAANRNQPGSANSQQTSSQRQQTY